MNQHKVLFVTASTVGGGAERQLVNIINSLADNPRYCLRLVVTSNDPRPNGLNTNVDFVQYGYGSSKASFGRLYSEISSFKPNYLFTTSSPLAYLLVFLKWLFFGKFKVVVRIAVPPSELYITSFKGRLLRLLSRFTLKYANVLVSQTEFMKEDLHKHYKIPTSKIIVIRNLIDPDFLRQSSESFVPIELDPNNFNVVAAGALYSVKGFDLLIKAFERIVATKPEAKLYILGQERYEPGYKDYLDSLITSKDNIFLLGQKANPYPYFKSANLFVLSSRKEAFPNVVLESLYLGTPVVATNCVDFSGIIIDGQNGYVVDKGSEDAMYHGITKAMTTLRTPIYNQISNYNYEKIFC